MAVNSPVSPPAELELRRYGNRKLYSPTLGRYVTLLEVAERVRAGAVITAVDPLGRDVADEVLARAACEEIAAGRWVYSRATLSAAIRDACLDVTPDLPAR
jgi:polyhydroxyalkanoate synthesis regulator protein